MFSDCQRGFTDISDDEVLSASQLIDECVSGDMWNDYSVSDDELVAASQAFDICVGDSSGSKEVQNRSSATSSTRRFSEPLTDEQLSVIQHGRFPKNTVNNATWAVTLFGEWRGERNRRCVEDNAANLVYLNKPFAAMSDDEINYCVPFFWPRSKNVTVNFFRLLLCGTCFAISDVGLHLQGNMRVCLPVVLFEGCRIVDIA